MLRKTILAVADAHASPGGLKALRVMLKDHAPDGLLVVGDLTTRGPMTYGTRIIEAASKRKTPVFAVGGNMDLPELHDWLERTGVGVHASGREFNGYKIVGIGGSNPTPFNTPVEYSEEQIYKFGAGLIDSRTIFMPHAPPLNTCADLTSSGAHVGSKAVRQLIEESQPAVAFCGHIHEAKGEQLMGRTKLVKLEPLMDEKAVLLELPSLKTKHLG
jgi:Icc-related predicted phosphoesterase